MKYRTHNRQQTASFFQKTVAVLCLLLVIVPQTVFANVSVTTVLTDFQQLRQNILTKIEEGISTAAAVGVKNGARAFLEKLAYDAAVTLTSGCEFQGPCINYKEFNVALDDAGDAAAGEFLNTIATQNGFVNLNLCDLPEYEKLQLTLLLPEITGTSPYEPSCTLSEIRAEVGDYSNDLQLLASTFIDDPTSLTTLTIGTMEGENALSSLLTLIDEQMRLEGEAERQEEIEQIKSDFKAIEAPISGYVKTPAAVLEYQTQTTYAQAAQAELTLTGNVFADALSVFTNTLAKRLLDQTASGLLSFYTDPDISDSVVATGGGRNSSTSGGASAARERFANLQTPSFRTGGELNVLNEFTSCPETGVSTTNCVIGQDFRRAIEEKMTLSQATDPINGPLISRDTPFVINADGTPIADYTAGLNKRSIAILQSYGVLPSTWMVAAEYNQQFDGTALTLGQLMDAFDDVSSPYYGLVDPNWLLKSPEVFCKVEGFSNTLAIDEYLDTDGSPNTPQEHTISRLSSCVDEQTCLSEDDSGNCEAYGYCTKYDDTYRFSGQECPAQFASCESFSNSDGENFSVLTNTINSADCADTNVGCQWACGVYNTVDEAFQCADQDTIYSTCTTEAGCSCETDSGDTCTIENGGFFCITDGGAECTIGTTDEEDANIDAAMTFDDNAQSCSDDDVGCSEFIPVKDGANLLFNYSFEAVNDTKGATVEDGVITATATDTAADQPFDDTFGFYDADGDGTDQSLAGEPCSAVSDPQTCIGWEFGDGATARAVLDTIDGAIAMQLSEGSGFVQHRFDTGSALAGRTFTMNFSAMNPTSNTCTGTYWIAPDGEKSSYTQSIDFGTDAGSYATEFPESITFPSDVTETTLSVGFSQPSGCDVVFDAVTVVEDTASPGIRAYGSADTTTYVNTSKAVACEPDEVGCTEYTPETGESDFVINGQITNPLSDVCGDGEDYTNPACSQCVEEFVGCDAYIEVAASYAVPVNDFDAFATAPSDQVAQAVAQRNGLYCDGTTTACNSDADCDSGVSCLPSVSMIPDAAESCSAQAVGCEEYVNLDTVAQGGEGKEYYTFIQQCVTPTQAQIDAGAIDFYYTFEGTESGYQLRSHYLKVSDDGSGAPCTNLDQYDYTGTAETAQADCIDSVLGAGECDPETDTDCVEYYDSNANTYFRKTSEVIEVSESCVSARNTLDGRVYNILPDESTSCRASENMCREYKGSEGNSARALIEDEFESTVWSGGTSSAESLSVDTGLSMLVTSAAPATYDLSGMLEQDQNYVIQFWAKGDGGTLNTTITSGASEISFDTDGTTIDDEWQIYNLGPVVFENGLEGNEVLNFEYSGAELYIDTVLLSESGSHYLLSDTLVPCNGYEGCEEYSDSAGDTHYLKSFSSLCDDDAVGCQALIATNQDADNPYYTVHNDDNESTQDDVPVGPHSVVTLAVTDDSLCDAENAGCQSFGQPSFDAYENVTSVTGYTATAILNDPDMYDTALCQEQQRWCDEWTAEDDESFIYAKNFGERYCEYDSGSGSWVTSEGNPCPLQNPNDEPSQPQGSVCNGGVRGGQDCTADSDCPDMAGVAGAYRCVSFTNDSIGWTGVCSDAYTQCTLYVDPYTETEVTNDSFELDQFENADYSNVEQDDKPDYWEVINEGDTGTSSGTSFIPRRHNSTDIVNAFVSSSPDSNIAFWHEDDIPFTSPQSSGSIEAGKRNFKDNDSGNPSSPQATVIGTSAADWNGMSQEITVTVDTSNRFSSSSLSFVFPALAATALKDDYLLFHISENGTLYWADSGHDGVKADGSDYLATGTALTEAHAVATESVITEEIEVNGFYDALDLSTALTCRFFEWVPDGFVGEYGMQIGAQNDTCMVGSNNLISVDTNNTYTLSGVIKAENADASFSLGLLYYDALGNEISTGADPRDYAIAAFEGTDRDDTESVQANTWVRYHGDIGPNLSTEFPEGTYYVRVFTEAGPDGAVVFDDIRFSANDEYTYIQNSVDTTSCNGEVDRANGCVPFRDTTNAELTQLSSANELEEKGVSFSTQSCTFDSPLANAACALRAFAADTNEVILVEQDRECSEWLACTDGEPIYNSSGDLEKVVCYDVGLCTKRNTETGACTQWAPNKNASDVTATDEVSTELSATNPLALNDVQRASSHAQIGGLWTTGECVDGVCSAGSIGDACSVDSDCHPEVDGYYPYNWLPYRGVGGSLSSDQLITNGDFEEVYCEGVSTSTNPQYDDWGVERAREKELSCTRDTHCRTLETDASLETYLESNNLSQSVESITYEDGWCENVDANTWSGGGNDWFVENANMNIIDYSQSEFQRMYDANAGVTFNPVTEGVGAGVAAGDLDLDNYMYVEPSANTASYIVVEIPANQVVDGQEYTMQFNGGAVGSVKEGDALDIFLQHDSSGTEKDYFVTAAENVQLKEGIRQYTFGPITANKSDASGTSYLYIGLGDQNQGTGFVLDDVKMAATLELNGDTQIGRECRAYPEEKSLQCTYTETDNDTIHQGWEGFCTVRDPFDSSKCITWFPVDSIPGEPNFSVQNLLFWNGHFPVYYCLAAKGNESLGTCTGTDQMCLTDLDCNAGQTCLGGDDGGSDTTDDGVEFSVSSDAYSTTIEMDKLYVDRYGSHVGTAGGADGETATFVKLTADDVPILKNMHISEIDNIRFDMGNPVFAGGSSVEPDGVWRVNNVTTFNLSEMEVEEADTSKADGYPLFEANKDNDSTAEVTSTIKGLSYAYQRGVWCNKEYSDITGICNSSARVKNNVENLGFYFVKAVTGEPSGSDTTPESDPIEQAGGVYNDDDPLNPFLAFDGLAPDSSVWEHNNKYWNDAQITGFTGNNVLVDSADGGVELDGEYFFSRHYDSAYSCMGSATIGCGANIMGFYVDVQDGYIDAIYLMYFDGLHRVDTEYMDDVSITFDLREVCLAATEVINDDASGTPWWQRATTGVGYAMQDIGYTYAMSGVTSLYGRMDDAPTEDGLEENFSDTDGDGDVDDFSNITLGADNNFPYVYHDEAHMKPLACIGSCGDLVCDDDRSAGYGDSCTSAFVGAGGICSDGVTACDDDADCGGGAAQVCNLELGEGDGMGSADSTTYYDQLNKAVDAGWNRLRLVFADLSPSRSLWFAPNNPNGDGGRYAGYLREMTTSETITSFCDGGDCNAFSTSSGAFDFDAMQECSGGVRGEQEYCGIRPAVEGITVNNRESGNIELSHGQSVSMEFETNTNDEQEPVQTVAIEWEADNSKRFNANNDVVPLARETGDGEMSYTHVYTCDPTQGDAVITDGEYGGVYCLYRVRVQIEDNWGFCSGNEDTSDIRNDCSSYDEYAGDIIVRP